jgi:predicted Zn-dependent protease
MSETQEVELGKKMDQELEKHYGFCGSPELVSYLNQIGQKIAAQADPRGFRYTFKILDEESINALALPGGYIYVTRGLLAVLNDEAELAGVIGHEVGHAASRHAAKQVTKARLFQLLSLGVMGAAAASPSTRELVDAWFVFADEFFAQILLGYGRENELEADEKGIRFIFRVGYDPRCMSQFLRYLRTKEQLSGANFQGFRMTHPETAERIIKADTLAFVLATGNEGKLETGTNRYRSQLEGLPYGHKDDRLCLKAYATKPGDSLSSIALALLGDETRAHEIAFLNRVKEGSNLEPGTILKIPSR